jgi:hypothetical protein
LNHSAGGCLSTQGFWRGWARRQSQGKTRADDTRSELVSNKVF